MKLDPRALPPEVDSMSTEKINAMLAERGIPNGELRPAALPDYDGDSDEHILAGGVTAGEAFALYKTHYDTDDARAVGIEVTGVSIAEVARRKVWLPDLTGRDAARKFFRNKAAELEKALTHARGQLELAKADAQRLYRESVLNRMALLFVLFDKLESTDHTPLREAYRKMVLDHPDVITGASEVEALLVGEAELMGEWVNAQEEAKAEA